MNENQIQQFLTSLTEIKGDIKVVGSDMADVKNHLEKLNGKTANTQERLTIVETELKPIKSIVNRVVWGVISSFMAIVAYMVYRK